MAKSSRASTVKANNRRLKRNVFGPVEAARLERLSAKLLETAARPKPEADAEDMKIVDGQAEAAADGAATETTTEDGESPSNPGPSARPINPFQTDRCSRHGCRARQVLKQEQPEEAHRETAQEQQGRVSQLQGQEDQDQAEELNGPGEAGYPREVLLAPVTKALA